MQDQSTTKTNATAFRYLVSQPIRPEMIDHIVTAASGVLWCNPAMKHPDGITQVQPFTNRLPPLGTFIVRLIRASGISTGTLVTTVVYLARLKKRLSPTITGSRCSAHRIFLSVLILTCKYLHDVNPTSKSWAQYCSYGMASYDFSATDIIKMEVQTLFLLDWDLSLIEEELYLELEPLLFPIRELFSWLQTLRQLPLPGVPQINTRQNDKKENGKVRALSEWLRMPVRTLTHSVSFGETRSNRPSACPQQNIGSDDVHGVFSKVSESSSLLESGAGLGGEGKETHRPTYPKGLGRGSKSQV